MLCLGSVLCAPMSSLQAQEGHEAKCLEYFTEIFEVQKFREMLMIGAAILTERYERGELGKKELDMTLAVWYITESRLREKVTKIYDVASAAKCFDVDTRKEEK